MAGAESHLTRSLLAAARALWDDVDWDRTRAEIRRYRDGSDAEPGSDNHSTLAYCIALIVAWKGASQLDRLGVTRQQVIDWWERELTVRLRKGLQLSESRSRIYAGWEAVLICWCRRAFAAFGALAELHLHYVRATAAMVALCAYPVRPRRYSPATVEAKLFDAPIFVTLAGARSWSGEREGGILHAHHLGQSAWECLAAHLLDIPIPREFQWERAMIDALDPGLMGLTRHEADVVRVAVRSGDPIVLEELVSWLDGVGTRWPCRLVRFESGAGCIGLDRAINGNTAPIYTMAVHEDGTIHLLTLDFICNCFCRRIKLVHH